MIRVLVFVFTLILSAAVSATELQYLNQVVLPLKMKFQKSTVGGISGLYFDGQSLFGVSDDRGIINEPRIYEFKLSVSLSEFEVEPKDVIFLTVNLSNLSHKSTKSKPQLFSKVVDLEGLSITPWGDFLLSNEGDNNHKPRAMPQIFSAKKDGTIVREFELPDSFLPEASGIQKKGIQNNLAFEGLAMNPNGKEWLAACEAPLIQDPKKFVRFLQFTSPEAWILKPGKEYRYPLDPVSEQALEFPKGISEIHYLDESKLLVLERGLQINSQGVKFQVALYETDLKFANKEGLLSKKKLLDLSELSEKIGKLENFEGMTLGPKLSDGRRTLILVSDDNFMRNQRTQFLLFAIKE